MDELVQLLRRLQVGAERLLHHDAGVLVQARLREALHDRAERDGRNREEEEPAGAPELVLRLRHRALERVALPRAEAAADVGQALREPVPVAAGVGGLHGAELLDRLPGEVAELVVRVVLARGADDAVAVRKQPRLGQVIETGEELPAREVPGCPEDDEHVVVGLRDALDLPLGARSFGDGGHPRSPPPPAPSPARSRDGRRTAAASRRGAGPRSATRRATRSAGTATPRARAPARPRRSRR